MATDIIQILKNLSDFYNFKGKSVIHVGAGGGQLIGYASDARHVTAVDPDISAVKRLQSAIGSLPFRNRFTVINEEFGPGVGTADVVFFEFCLHEMTVPASAIEDAKRQAPDVLVLDHDPDSRWAWHTAETEKAFRSWAAVEKSHIRSDRRFAALQHFADVDELAQKIGPLGEPAITRAQALANQKPIQIEMKYRIALL